MDALKERPAGAPGETSGRKERPTGAPGETPGWAPKTKKDESRESDFNVRNEVVSSLDWAASFVREQSRKASDATFASALESVAAKVADMSQGVKNAFQELVLARAGNGGGRGVESASQKMVLARAGKRRRDKGE